MTLRLKDGRTLDTMKDACDRLGISRTTMLRCLRAGFFPPPPTHPQGRGKLVRYFDEAWYAVAETKLEEERQKAADRQAGLTLPPDDDPKPI